MEKEKKKSENPAPDKHSVMVSIFLVALFVGAYFGIPLLLPSTYDAQPAAVATEGEASYEIPAEGLYISRHVETPDSVRGIYLTQCVAATPSWRASLAALIDETELNSVIIDIKDYTGTIGFRSEHPLLKKNRGEGCRAADLPEFIETLHKMGIYVIGRITVFQDPYYTSTRPDLAVRRASATTTVWTDYKGLSFVDVGAREFWDYIVAISEESHRLGVDELNYDYIRYPSDGNMRDIHYVHSDGGRKADELEKFFAYLDEKLEHSGAVLSADLFGMTTTNTDDLNIGQQLERALPYFDYIAPMVYPSHYPAGFRGYTNVNAHPYDIVKFSMDSAVKRLLATTTPIKMLDSLRIGTSTPAIYSKTVYDPKKLRPWLQDFDYPVPYTPDMVVAQIQAAYDAGLDSWMLWDPTNTYTPSILEKAAAFEI